jgi:hypothetical protein
MQIVARLRCVSGSRILSRHLPCCPLPPHPVQEKEKQQLKVGYVIDVLLKVHLHEDKLAPCRAVDPVMVGLSFSLKQFFSSHHIVEAHTELEFHTTPSLSS